MGERMEKVKSHLKENKKSYIACGVTAVVTAVGTIVVMCRKKVVVGDQDIVQVLSYKPHANQHLEVWIEALGDPGNVIQDTTTGTIYPSQGQAARELGLTPSRISNQLNGRTPHVEGHTFAKIGKAGVSSGLAE